MEIAKLILEYIKVLIWPSVVLYVAVRHSKYLDALLHRISNDTQEIQGFGWKAIFRTETIAEKSNRLKNEIKDITIGEVATKASDTPNSNSRPLQLNQYLLTEELVFRTLEARWGKNIKREMAVDLPGNTLQFDGLADDGDSITLIEIKLVTRSFVPQSVFKHEISKAAAVKEYLRKPVKFLMVVVSTLSQDDLDEIVKSLRESSISSPVSTTVEGFRFEELVNSLLGKRREGIANNPINSDP